MFKYKFYKFLSDSYALILEISNTKIFVGSFFTENSIIDLPQNKTESSFSIYPFTKEEEDIIKNEIFPDLEIMIITHFNDILCLPHIFTNFGLSYEKIKFYSTEPILQLSRAYMKEFYSNFNNLLLNNSTKDSNISIIQITKINEIISKFKYLNFNQKENYLQKNFNPSLSIELTSSGHELGSSNIILSYLNKRIFIMTKSSYYSFRFPKKIDFMSPKNCEIVIQFPNIINENPNLDFEKGIVSFISELNRTVSKSNTNSKHSYPVILMIAEPFYMYEFVDSFRYKIQRELKNVYLSKSIDPLLKYANINTGFINEETMRKIIEPKLPFSFDELKDTFFHFESFGDMIKKADNEIVKEIGRGNSPVCFIVNKFSFHCCEQDDVLNFFLSNLAIEIDKIITINYSKNEKFSNANYKVLDLNYDLTPSQNEIILNQINAKKISRVAKDMTDDSGFHYEIGKWNYDEFTDEEVLYEQCYLTFQPKKSADLSLKFKRENKTFYISKESKKKTKEQPEESAGENNNFKKMLGKYLSLNEMEIKELNISEREIQLKITKKDSTSSAEVKIFLNERSDATNDESSSIEIESENYQDTFFLNTIFQSIFE